MSATEKQARATGSKAEVSYELLRSRILDGTYGPGYRLVLSQLARETGVSTIPLREALRRLQSDGLVEVVRNIGARVAVFDAAQVEHSLHVLARLEGYATAISAPHMTARHIQRSRRINARMTTALEDFDPASFTALNREFHFSLYEHCPDAHLVSLLEAEWARLDHMRRSTFSHVPGRARRSVEEHERLLELIGERAGAQEIERVACAHKIATAEALHRSQSGE
ncbi:MULTISPECIES: GntR family transcriptional regulator [unclassified Streptomyces]|uniref:GntR family transcriptional regulator n=1 Tax=unclassified Streptomyces TaxID=2593676 RepID=UPI00136BBD94|nr:MULTISPECIES: GntR family transcriptional regulator [unclassified Streptomyces]MCW5252573.1 GntR family transcriptional regulator [Streptomyces sp. SHP 1-2]MYU26446.1 FCD domain-containing protein [Streptomyces sp. SID8352]